MTNHCDHCRTDGDGCPGDATGIHEDIGQYDWLTGTCPACKERRAIVAWLLSNPYQWEMDDREGSDYAEAIESGTHLRGDDE